VSQALFVSATPGPYELEKCDKEVVEQLVRPTGLVDPPIEVRPAEGQVADVMAEVGRCAERKERSLITTLTKRLAEDLAEHIRASGLRGRYLHSELDAFERVEILRDLRQGEFDVLVGVNLLREGLDLPEVALVAILDADKEGFLRSRTSLIQTIGRTARNVNGRVVLYAERRTEAIEQTIAETGRRREAQLVYNKEHGITPKTVRKEFRPGILEILGERTAAEGEEIAGLAGDETRERLSRAEMIGELEGEMYRLAKELEFAEAAKIRDRILEIQGRAAQSAPGARGPKPGEPGYRGVRSRKRRSKGPPPRRKRPK